MMQSKPRMAPPPDLPYPLPATSAASGADAQPPIAGVTGRNTSAVSVVPPRHATGAAAHQRQPVAAERWATSVCHAQGLRSADDTMITTATLLMNDA